MGTQILFKETQRFKQIWIWLLFLLINGTFIFGIYKQIIMHEPFGDKPKSNFSLLLNEGILLLICATFFSFRLETEIRTDGIYVRFFPLHLKQRFYAWEKIQKCNVRKYKPIREFGGWGIRGFNSNRAFSVSGKNGLQLEFTDGKKLLIGTIKPDEISNVLAGMGK